MAFKKSRDFTINHSTFIDNSNNNAPNGVETWRAKGLALELLLNASSTDATFNSQARNPPPRCHPNTRKDLLDYIYKWVETGEEKILFLDGPAGAGKTALAQTVAESYSKKKRLLASYFFLQGSPSQNTIEPLIPTITYQITSYSSRNRKKIKKKIEHDPSLLTKSPNVQVDELILKSYRPSFFRWSIFAKQKRSLFIVDGLDECEGDHNQRQIVEVLGQLVENKHFIGRCLIASRPELHILEAVNLLPMKVARVTLNEQTWDATGDVRLYLRFKFDEIAKRLPSSIPRPWPPGEIIETLVQKAGGIFIYVSTVLKYVDDPDSLPTIQLRQVLALSPGPRPFAEIDKLYEHILMSCPLQHHSTLLHIFGFIFLHNPIFKESFDISLIEELLELSPGEVAVVLRRMHSILTFTTDGSRHIIQFLHASLGDFLFDKQRSGSFFIDRERESLFLATKCIKCLTRNRESNMRSVDDPYIMYAWNSWPYHGKTSGKLPLADIVFELSCNLDLWAEIEFSGASHHSCMDNLGAGIAWLQQNCEVPFGTLISSLTSTSEKLKLMHHIKQLVNGETTLTILCVFKDPGIVFFEDLKDSYVVIQEQDGKAPKCLYFRCHNRVCDLRQSQNTGLETSTEILEHLGKGRSPQHSFIAIRCIRTLKGTGPLGESTSSGVSYSAKYWAKHLYWSIATVELLEELSKVGLEGTVSSKRITPGDVRLVIHWLETNTLFPRQHTTISLWRSHFQCLVSEPQLGLCDAKEKKVNRRKSFHIPGSVRVTLPAPVHFSEELE